MSAAALLPGYVGYVRPAPGAQAVPGNFDAVLVYAVVEHRDERRLRMEFQEPPGGLRRELVRLHRRDGVIAYPHLVVSQPCNQKGKGGEVWFERPGCRLTVITISEMTDY